ncbi:C45 family autoproteolytic acyltransferase/hydolase [Nocardia tengchongensis]|uniref:C45 family autoproteolytic acyltransferase/hydolase n=1 Tax=Nocardia tengchongensis TaxID=2055889 RepID=UPI003622A03A
MLTEDSYLLAPAEGDYLSVRTVTARGGDEEIGADLARLGRTDFGARIAPYSDPIYAQARRTYLERNHPALAARARGVAAAFGMPADGDEFDTTAVGYDVPGGPACSAVWFPPALTTTGRPLFGRNMDWYTLPLSATTGMRPGPDEHPSCSRTVLVTTVGESGRAVAQLGCHDLVNPGYDGVNDAGLMMALLVDHTAPGNPGTSGAGFLDHGLSSMQLIGYVLDQATTVAEAKRSLLTQHIFVPVAESQHWLIADAQGAATVFEIDRASRQYRFTDAPADAPFIITNHALHTYPTMDTFPAVDPSREHDSFVRYRMLSEAIGAHRGLWSPADIDALLDVVLCAFTDDAAAGVSGGVPERTLWNYLADPVARTYRFRFHQCDLGPEPGTNHMRVQRTDHLEWSLDKALS